MANSSVIITISAKDLASAVFKQIGTEVKAGADKAVKGLEKYQAGLEKTGKAATQLGKGLSVGVTAPLAAFGAIAVNSAVKAERLTKTLNGLAGGADEAAGFIKAIKDASLGTIPQVQALEIANSALSFGVVETEEGMASLVETAIVLGKAQGLDAATAVGDLTTALARQSPMILDNLGITLKMSEASLIAAENATRLGFDVDNLTKAQEFQIAAMVKGAEAAAKMGGMQEDTATKVERAKAEIADMTTTIGAALIPALSTALDVIMPIISAFGDLDSGAQAAVVGLLAVAAGAGPVITVLGTVFTVASKIPAAMTAIKTAAIGMNPAFIGVAVAIGAVVAVGKVYHDQQEKIKKASQEAADAADLAAQGFAAQADAGRPLPVILAESANRMNKATGEWNNMSNAAKVGVAVFGAQDKMTKVLTQNQQSMTQVILENSDSYENAMSNIALYNSQLTDVDARLSGVTEAQFNMALSTEEVASSASLLTDESEQLSMAQQENLRTIDMLGSAQERAATRSEQMGAAVAMTGEQMGAASDAVEAHRAGTERAARVTQLQAESATRQAAALEASRLAAIGAAEAQVMLASSLKDATDAQIASALIEQLDPEALGAAAFAEGVTTIQKAFGLADEESIALSENLGPLAEAMNAGIIPTEEFDEALTALIQDAADGEVNTGLLLNQFARAPGLIGSSADELKELNEKLILSGEDALIAEEGLIKFGKAVEGPAGAVDALTASVAKLNEELGKVGAVALPSVSAGPPGGRGQTGPGFQFGGTVPGPIGGAPRLVVAEPGEVFTPPSQIGGPTNNFGGNTQTVIINDAAALGFFEEQQRQERLSRLSVNL